MHKILFPAILFICLYACNRKDISHQTLNPSLIESSFFEFDPAKDNRIVLPKGTIIHIAAGTFTSLHPVKLEVKEVYTAADILLAGLITESGGKPLSSAGMLYINTVDQQLLPGKAINLVIPAEEVDHKMKLFTGITAENKNIDWQQPIEIPFIKDDTMVNAEALFSANCRSCHSVYKTLTGPALKGVEERVGDQKLLYAWIKDNQSVLKSGNTYFNKLYATYNKTPMNTFPCLTDPEIAALLRYINTVPAFADTSIPSSYNDSGFDTSQAWSENMYRAQAETGIDTLLNSPEAGKEEYSRNNAYMFSIKTLGWYNLDKYVKETEGLTLCELTVLVEPAENWWENMEVYLLVPNEKILSRASPLENGKFIFNWADDKTPLFLDDKAVIVAHYNDGEKFYFDTKTFSIQKKQLIRIQAVPGTKEAFLQAIKSLQFEGASFDLNKEEY